MATKKHILQTQGISKKGSGKKAGKSYESDTFERPKITLGDRGPGTSHTLARLREEAQRLREERKIPGNLGYRTNLGTRPEVAGSAISKEKGKLLNSGKKAQILKKKIKE